MKNNGSSGNVVKKKQLKKSTSKKRRRHKKIAKKTTVYTNDIHNVITKSVMVNSYSTVELDKLYKQSKFDTAIKYSISQPLKKTEQLNKLKHDLKYHLNKRVSRKKHVMRSGFIYHPEIVTKYVYNHKSQLNSEIQSNHQQTQEFLRSLNQPNIVNELQHLDKNVNINYVDTDARSTKNEAEYAHMENSTDKQEYLNAHDYLNGLDHEKLNIVSKVEPITKDKSMIFNTEYFEKHDLIDLLDYKNKKLMRDNNLDNFNNENMDSFKKSGSVATLKSDYFSKLSKIIKSKNIDKREDDTENTLVEIESTNTDFLHKDNEKYNIEHDYIFKEELRKIAEDSNKPNEDKQEISTESEYKTVPKYTPNEKNERDDINDYSVNAFDLENTLAVDNTLSNPDINLVTPIVVANTYLHNKTTVYTTPALRIQERFGKTATDLKQTQISLVTKLFIRPSTVRSQNITGT